jgi:hypothetical protein
MIKELMNEFGLKTRDSRWSGDQRRQPAAVDQRWSEEY